MPVAIQTHEPLKGGQDRERPAPPGAGELPRHQPDAFVVQPAVHEAQVEDIPCGTSDFGGRFHRSDPLTVLSTRQW
jgi:hypothetical protein